MRYYWPGQSAEALPYVDHTGPIACGVHTHGVGSTTQGSSIISNYECLLSITFCQNSRYVRKVIWMPQMTQSIYTRLDFSLFCSSTFLVRGGRGEQSDRGVGDRDL